MGLNIFSLLTDSNDEGDYLIPSRDPGASTGSAWVQANLKLGGAVREQNILDEFLHGNVPPFMRDFKPVKVTDGVNTITYVVTPDYLCLGTNEDYLRVPMAPITAQKIADKYDCTLPTRKMVKDIWKNATNKLPIKTTTPDAKMVSTQRYADHNKLVTQSITGDFTQLSAGHKKDVVLTNRLAPKNAQKRVAIFGWFYPNGTVVQDLNPSDHDDMYADYSHGIRLIANDVIVNGNPMRIQDVFKDPVLSKLLSDEGPLQFLRY